MGLLCRVVDYYTLYSITFWKIVAKRMIFFLGFLLNHSFMIDITVVRAEISFENLPSAD